MKKEFVSQGAEELASLGKQSAQAVALRMLTQPSTNYVPISRRDNL